MNENCKCNELSLESEKINHQTGGIVHPLVQNKPSDEPMGLSDVITSYGFLKIMGMIWIPTIIFFITVILVMRKSKRK